MSTGIRFPVDLAPPDRDGYGDEFEDTRGKFAPEIGANRRRQRMRATPRTFTVQWTMSQADYHIFDVWWQNTIKGGAMPFDILLLDDDETLTWFTAYWVGEYDAEIVGVMDWRVRGTLRTIAETFGTVRPSGTDELKGQAAIGIGAATGDMLIAKVLKGTATVGLATVEGHLSLPPLHGSAEVGMYSQPTAKFGPMPFHGSAAVGLAGAEAQIPIVYLTFYPELSRQWQDLDWVGSIAAQDINGEPGVPSREWMGI